MPTASYSFNLPTVGGDENLWGAQLNANWEQIDDLLDGTAAVTGIDINSGTIDGTSIGATVPSTGTFTTGAFSGALSLADGTAGAPTLTNIGDTDTGIFFSASNTVAIAAGGSAVATFSTGTTTLNSLNINEDVPTVVFHADIAPVDEARYSLRNANGDLQLLSLTDAGATAQSAYRIERTGTNVDRHRFFADGLDIMSITTDETVIARGDFTVNGIINGSNDSGTLQLSGGSANNGAQLSLFGSDAVSAPNEIIMDGEIIRFRSEVSAERARINATGLGIGTTNPARALHINNASPVVRLQDSDGTNQFAEFSHAGGSLSISSRDNASNSSILFGGAGGGSFDEYARFDTTGRFIVLKAVRTVVATVATLPSGAQGDRGFVTDANSTTFNALAVGGGSNAVPVFHNGSSWRIG